jgi:hypothetical protein
MDVEAIFLSETLANFYRTTRRYVPEDGKLLVGVCFGRSKVASSKLFRLLT